MNQRRRLIVKDVYKTTAGKVTVSVLGRFFQIFSNSANGKYHQAEVADPAGVYKFRDISAMSVKPNKDIIAELLISDFLFLGCLS